MKAHRKIEDVDVIAPNFKQRLSGVTSTIIQLVPLQAQMGVHIATLGPGLPAHLPSIRYRDLWRLWKRPAGKPARVWHARRNVEMIGGLVLRDVLRMPLRLVFTSAAQRAHKPFTRFLIARMNCVISTSSKSAAFLNVPNSIIMHGINTLHFTPSNNAKIAIRKQMGIGSGQKLIGCFGRVRHQKGTDLFVDAMIRLLPKYPDWHAVICGRATDEHVQYAAELRSRVKAENLCQRIHFLGEVPNILPYYQAIDLYVAPSRNEGFGLTPLEAMACGVPVVTSDAGAYADMVQPGFNGAICPANDGGALTAAIGSFLGEKVMLLEIGNNALQFVQKKFALDTEASALNAIYAALIAKSYQN